LSAARRREEQAHRGSGKDHTRDTETLLP
jgi:hypothetical protein